jgi:hypothetical protein
MNPTGDDAHTLNPAQLQQRSASRAPWVTFTWGLSRRTSRRQHPTCRDRLVVLSPDLTPDARARQIRLITTWLPAVETCLTLLPTGVAVCMIPWIGGIPLLITFIAWLPLVTTFPEVAERVIHRAFHRYAPARDRRDVGGQRGGRIDTYGWRLHEVLLHLAIQAANRIDTRPTAEHDIHQTLWAELRANGNDAAGTAKTLLQRFDPANTDIRRPGGARRPGRDAPADTLPHDSGGKP